MVFSNTVQTRMCLFFPITLFFLASGWPKSPGWRNIYRRFPGPLPKGPEPLPQPTPAGRSLPIPQLQLSQAVRKSNLTLNTHRLFFVACLSN